MKRSRPVARGYVTKHNDPPIEASVYVEQAGRNKYKIQSDQLERIGKQLRGRSFFVLHSIVLPFMVTVFTLFLTSFLQYVSWANSVSLQKATDLVDNARHAYERAADAIGKRQYATVTFFPSLKDLARETKPSVEPGTNARDVKNNVKDRKSAESSPLSASAAVELEIPLYKSDLDKNQRRYASYYTQVQHWNENYDRMLYDIEYALDRPIFSQIPREVQKTNRRLFKTINCSNSLTEELKRLEFNSDSLKLRFAAIDQCFTNTDDDLDKLINDAKQTAKLVYDEQFSQQHEHKLKRLRMVENVFRCYALGRINYYTDQKELSILRIPDVWESWRELPIPVPEVQKIGKMKTRAEKHFGDIAGICDLL
jgi:hypothetical protein